MNQPAPRQQDSVATHAKRIAVLGLPLVGSHVAQFAITLTDALMLGWYDVTALAGQVLGGTMFFVLFIMGSGFAFAVMPMVAAAAGSGEETQVRRVTRMALWASTGFGLLVLPFFVFSGPIFGAMGQDPEVARLAGQYLAIQGFAILPALFVMVLKSYLSALERTQVVLWVTCGAVLVNVAVNWVLIFGNLGAPELGVIGAAWASLIVNIVSMLALGAYALRALPEHELLARFWRVDTEALWRVFRLGWPIGLTNLAEVGLFSASSIMMGWLGPVPLAAHGIALQISATAFMVHLGLSNAATVRAGNALGRGDWPGLRRGAKVVTVMSLAVALVTMVVFVVFPDPLIGLFLDPEDPDRPQVLLIGAGLLAAAALFQLCDAAQVMALGLLRGVLDTRVPMWIAAVSYWLIGVPVSYVLGFVLGWEGIGVWLGLAAGLAVAGVALTIRFWRLAARPQPEAQPAEPPEPALATAGPRPAQAPTQARDDVGG